MSTFVIILDADGEQVTEHVKDRLQQKFKTFYEYTETVFMVSGDVLTEHVANSAGLKGSERIDGATGVVFRVGGYSGYTNQSLWEWFEQVES